MSNYPPLGFTFAGVACGLKKTGAADFALVVSDRPCSAAAVFTQNKFPAAPVLYDRALDRGQCRLGCVQWRSMPAAPTPAPAARA